jgi:hypothetical protein
MIRLTETGLVEETRSGLNVSYSLKRTCAELVTETIALLEAN